MEVLSGNSSDKETFPLSVEAYNQQLGESETPYYVMDSAGYAADNLKTLKGMLWLMRVPETLAQAKRLIRESEKMEMQPLAEGYWGKEVALQKPEQGAQGNRSKPHTLTGAKRTDKPGHGAHFRKKWG